MTAAELLACRQADILTCDVNDLTDLRDVNICSDLPLPHRAEQYLAQIKNPYLFKVDSLIVKVSFNGNRDLMSKLSDLMA